MERAGPPGSPCPQVGEPPARDAPPDTTALRWYRSTDQRDLELSRVTCSGVGIPVFRADAPADFPAWRVGDSLRVVSWSVDGESGDLRGLLADELGLSCRGPASTLRSGYPGFVLLLQKSLRASPLEGAGSGAGVVDVARECGLSLLYVASSSAPTSSGGDRGSAVLSTLPMTTPLAIDLPLEASRAVAVAATIVLPGGERLRVVSAHVDGLSTLARTLMGANQARARQVAGLIEGLDRADDDGPLTAATLVGVDLSLWDDRETAMRLMERAFPESPAWDGLRTRGAFASDHVFFRRGSFRTITVGRYRRLEDSYGSGHQGRGVIVSYIPLRGSPQQVSSGRLTPFPAQAATTGQAISTPSVRRSSARSRSSRSSASASVNPSRPRRSASGSMLRTLSAT